jgi:hypothetical protein
MKRCVVSALVVLLWFMANQSGVRAGRGVSALPHVENFATSNWLDEIRWTSQGALARHMTGVNWDGGNAARFWLPTVDQGYAALGEFQFTGGLQPRRLNIRFIYQWGSTFLTDDVAPGPKQLIVLRSTGMDTDRFIAQQHGFGPGDQWDLGIGNNTLPEYPNPRVWNYGEHTGQPVCFEFELIVGGQLRVFVTKRNDSNWNQRLLISQPTNNNNGYWSAINLLGGYGGPGRAGSADPNAWYQFSNLVISNTYIGPPAGFTSGSPMPVPQQPTNLRMVR